MDEKNLAVLKKLKDSLSAPSEPAPKFLDAQKLLGLLTEVNLRLHGEPKDIKKPRKKKSPSLPTAKNQKPKGADSKPSKRGDSKANSAERKAIRDRATAKALAAANAFKSSQQIRPCIDCGAATNADPEFFLNPVMCQRCKDRSRDVDLGIHPRKHDDFSEIKVFKGGSPGLGKRK